MLYTLLQASGVQCFTKNKHTINTTDFISGGNNMFMFSVYLYLWQ